ncbi:MAG: ribonuclease Z [Chlamydiota bacterium]
MSKKELIALGTSSQQPTRFRSHGAYLVRMCQEGFLFDPGEGTQRQFIFAEVAPTSVTHIFISHFHGDHCLGVGSMLMRLNLDRVEHPVRCYFPASGAQNFTYLRKACLYHENISVEEHPIEQAGVFLETDTYTVRAEPLEHGVPTLGYRIEEKPRRKFDPRKLHAFGVRGPLVKALQEQGRLQIGDKTVTLEEVSWVQEGDVFAYVLDTLSCENAVRLAEGASMILAESTYLHGQEELAKKYLHMTAQQAALIAQRASAKKLILTHFSARYRDVTLFEEEARQVFPESYAARDLSRFAFPS